MASPAAALDKTLTLPAPEEKPVADAMKEGRIASTPFGFKKFCQKEKAFCRRYRKARSAPKESIELDDERLEELLDVNESVNEAITAVPEFLFFASYRDEWRLPKSSGDCEDFALLKQSQLIEKGWPESALLISVVETEDGDRHAVLLVRTNFGELVLDNLTDEIVHWRKADYTWIKRQSTRNMMRWVKIKIEKKSTDGERT